MVAQAVSILDRWGDRSVSDADRSDAGTGCGPKALRSHVLTVALCVGATVLGCGWSATPAAEDETRILWKRGPEIPTLRDRIERHDAVDVGPADAAVAVRIDWEYGIDESDCPRIGSIQIQRESGPDDVIVEVHSPPPPPDACKDPRRPELWDIELAWRQQRERGAIRVALRADGRFRPH